ncbi:MAG TPA: SLBB domain-containing protein [Gemmatimonadales bacterium]|nr:SLBB domain-containing protein [Gemmatimonadales bacterium]
MASDLMARIAATGLSPAQIRDRLAASGYSQSVLDSYLSDRGAYSEAQPLNANVFAAVRALGIADNTELEAMQRAAGVPDSMPALATLADSIAWLRTFDPVAADSLAKLAAISDTMPRVFGLDIFRSATTLFEPNMAGPVDANYELGPGDRLVLVLTGDIEAAYSLDVTREGFVVVPQVGQIHVANLSMANAERLFRQRLSRSYSGIGSTTRFSLSVASMRSNQVFVLGDVARPGSYRISAAGTALTALYAAGGPSDNGSLRQVIVRRGGTAVDTLDLYDYLLRGDASRDPRLLNGDVVFVPVHGAHVRIGGEVIRPGIYELRHGESLQDLVRSAGGFTATAARQRLQVDRILPPSQRVPGGRDRVTIDVASSGEINGGVVDGVPALPLEPGDEVRVLPVVERVRNRVSVEGHVWTPGLQGYAPGMTLSQALRAAGGLRPDAYLGRVIVNRLQQDSTRVMLHAAVADTTGAVLNDLRLQEDDEIRVFSRVEFRPERHIVVTGAVRQSGQFPYQEGMTLRDVLLLAGGLQEGADLREAEIARLPRSRENGQIAQTIRVPMDSTYLFDRDADGRYLGPPGVGVSRNGTPDVPLEPYDNILILRQPDFELQHTVYVGGEVQFPGRYALTSKQDRVTDVLKRAGGVTSEGHPGSVTFVRTSNNAGRIGIDLPSVLRDVRHRDNLLLQHGDSIVVPRYSAVVMVRGAVNSPVAVSYREGAPLSYYLRSAGGTTRMADKSLAYVRQGNGQVEAVVQKRFRPDYNPVPTPGSTVFVPEKDPNAGRDLSQTIALGAQVFGVLATAAALLLR